ncbi:MAG: ComF family protein [Gemmatimonadota bacterium]|nr:ComF family protein [Gemmatimonadota bacterium]
MSLRVWSSALGAGALDLVFAPICAGCGVPVPTAHPERLVCALCRARLRPIPTPHCPRCWAPLPISGEACPGCAEIPPAVRAVRSAVFLEERARSLLHALKYRGWSALAAPLAARMAELPLPIDVMEEAEIVVAVPTSRVRLRERGYNQAALLASSYALRTGRRAEPGLLVRGGSAGTQTSLHPDERRANVAHAFSVPPPRRAELAGAHLLLVDDVWTTGATALACAHALLEAGARVVSVVTFARVLPELECLRG